VVTVPFSTTPKGNPSKMQKSSLLNPRFKTLEHVIELFLVVAAIILTIVYLNMGIRPSRSEIMIIPIVRAPGLRAQELLSGFRALGS
jgi:hypothetical protein